MRVLLLGIGNPGRQDDGLGPALAEALGRSDIPGLTLDADYQLTVEDAAALAECDVVVFADADAAGPEPFSLRRVEARQTLEFTSHGVEPDAVVGLAKRLFGRSPEAWIFGIRGYRFGELAEGLSPKARQNLEQALAFLAPLLRAGGFEEAAARLAEGSQSTEAR
jgi:hydrogenase maturation protease